MDLLDPEAVAKGEALGLLARKIVEGYRVGEHRSPFQGFALEFAQHREYGIGDDLKHLDWKLHGRTDRFYIKQYEQDTNFTAHILLDGSRSMEFGSAGTSKLDYAKVLVACLAHTILTRRDAVALEIFDTDTRVRLARTDSPGRLHEMMVRLAGFQADSATDIGLALHNLASRARSKGIAIVVSDFFDQEKSIAEGVERLRFQGTEVIVFQVLDPQEISFDLNGPVRFLDLEGDFELSVDSGSIRQSYLQEFTAFLKRVRHACERANAHYILADTSLSVAETLSSYLAFRGKAVAR